MTRKRRLARIIRQCLRAHAQARELGSAALMRSLELTITCAETAPNQAGQVSPRKA